MSTLPLVVFQPSGKRGRFAPGTKVLDAARQLGVHVESVCGGRGICGRCQIEPVAGTFPKLGITSTSSSLSDRGPVEDRYANVRDLPLHRRLGCSAAIVTDTVIDVPAVTAGGASYVVKADDGREIERDPAIRLHYVEVAPASMENPMGDAERLLAALTDQWDLQDVRVAPHLFGSLQTTLRRGDWKVTVAVHAPDEATAGSVVAMWPGLKDEVFGIACDVGSTTIALHLVSLSTGAVVATAGMANPQIRFGEDLMSRVSYVMMNPDGREALTRTVREAIDGLVGDVCDRANIARDDVLDAAFVGNPIMHHLLLGIDPTELGQAPFALAVSGAVELPMSALDVTANPGASAYVLPCVAGHVGADAAAATLAVAPHASDADVLLVDIGTNAEIVLGNRERVLAASSPTGPAFEGAEISCGQRAAPGAIERVRIDPQTLEPKFRVIGVEPWSDDNGFSEAASTVGVTGLCGSAIIEVVAEMFLAGVIDEDGVIDGALACRTTRIVPDGRSFSYVVHEADGDQPVVKVTQNDVRAIQLAKAALYAGVKLLMSRAGIEKVAEIRLAGAFGTHIDPTHAMVLGLVPDCDTDSVRSVGNAAGAGARMALLNRVHRAEAETLVRRIEKVETAIEPGFQEQFIAAMAFPNKRDAFPRLAQAVALPERKVVVSDVPRRRGGRARAQRTVS